MAHWKNPTTRKIGKHTYHLHAEGMEKPNAIYGAGVIRKEGGLARIVVDERLGRYDVKNRGPYYCIYYVHRRQK
jgi:hypothetical protein